MSYGETEALEIFPNLTESKKETTQGEISDMIQNSTILRFGYALLYNKTFQVVVVQKTALHL